jgi:type II protein arginine methyltransferase
MADLKDKIAALESLSRDNPGAMLVLAYMLRKDGQEARALELSRSALAHPASDAVLVAKARAFINDSVPGWHIVIVQDEVRNAAYDKALRRAIRPNSRVLEIGAGTGVLAMMAARAGATQVVSCEMNPAVAAKAREIVARNGYADRVRIIAKHSDTLDAKTDMGGRADVLVSEIISNNLLGEDVLSAHERALRDLLKPEAKVIPAGGCIRVALAEDARDASHRLGNAAGFDLSSFNGLSQPIRQIRAGHARLALRSEPTNLFAFNFASPDYCAPSAMDIDLRSSGGRVNGVAQWIALELDEDTIYENRPTPGAQSCWAVLFYPLEESMETQPGEIIRVYGAHDRHNLTIWAQPQP